MYYNFFFWKYEASPEYLLYWLEEQEPPATIPFKFFNGSMRPHHSNTLRWHKKLMNFSILIMEVQEIHLAAAAHL